MIFSLLNGIFIFGLFIEIVKRRFPNEFDRFTIFMSFNCIYFYSKLQICLVQLNNKLNKIIEGNHTLLKLKTHINILSNNNTCQQMKIHCEKYELYIYKTYHGNETFDKISYSNDDNFDFEESNIKFILVELKIGENDYKIDFKNSGNYNYYLVGNKFTKKFFLFHLYNTHHNIDIKEDTKISLKIIDDNVDTHEIVFTDKNESILLEKNSYKVVSSNE